MAPQESVIVYELIGQAANQKMLSSFLQKKLDVAYFNDKKARAHELTSEIGSFMATKTANAACDDYCQYTFIHPFFIASSIFPTTYSLVFTDSSSSSEKTT